MLNNKNIIPPEILAEQIFSYSIQGHEALKFAKKEIKSGYNFVLIPKGSHIYTGILQVTGYLMLEPSQKDLIIISGQSNNPDKIEIYKKKVGPILGFNFSGLKATSLIKKYFETDRLPPELEFQLNIARIIQNTKKYMHIGLGSNIEHKEIKTLIQDLRNNYSGCNLVFLTNLSQNQPIKQCKSIDTKIIEDVSMKRLENTFIKNNVVLNTYTILGKKINKTPEVLMYTNSGDLDGNKKNTNGYVCMVF